MIYRRIYWSLWTRAMTLQPFRGPIILRQNNAIQLFHHSTSLHCLFVVLHRTLSVFHTRFFCTRPIRSRHSAHRQLDQVSKIKNEKRKKNRKRGKRNSNSHGYREVRISFSSACSVLQKQDGKTKRTKNGMVGSKRFAGFLWLSLQRFLVIFERSNVAVVAVAVANRSTHKRELFKTKNQAAPRGNKVKGVKGGWVEVTRARKKFACSCVPVKGVR